jgi:hypothetical protein
MDVGVHHPGISSLQQVLDTLHRLAGAASWPKAVAVFSKPNFEDGFHHIQQRTLNDTITHSGNAQGPQILAARLLDPLPFDRSRFITTLAQQSCDGGDFLSPAFGEGLGCLAIDSCRAFAGRHLLHRNRHRLWRPDFVNQGVPLLSFVPSYEGLQHAWGPDPAGSLRKPHVLRARLPAILAACSSFEH